MALFSFVKLYLKINRLIYLTMASSRDFTYIKDTIYLVVKISESKKFFEKDDTIE